MKILHVEAGKHLYGGARQVQYLAEGMAKQGVTPLLVCPIGSEIARQPLAGVKTLPIPMGGDADIGLVFRLLRILRTEQPDLMHIHSRRGADVWGGVAARLAGIPCVLSRRVDNRESPLAVALKYRLYDHVITISQGILQVLLDAGVPACKLSCVRSAVDPDPYLTPVDRQAFLNEFGLPDSALVMGMVAQMIPRKGYRYLLATLPALLAHHPHLHLLIFGQGPLDTELRQHVSQQSWGHHVHFAGFRRDLPRWLGGLDLLVHPADMEGLGVSLLQASAAAVPIVASRAGGLPEAVEDGVTGYLTPPGDVPTLTTTIDRLLSTPSLRHQLGQAGRARILSDFSIHTMIAGNLAIYRHVLNR